MSYNFNFIYWWYEANLHAVKVGHAWHHHPRQRMISYARKYRLSASGLYWLKLEGTKLRSYKLEPSLRGYLSNRYGCRQLVKLPPGATNFVSSVTGMPYFTELNCSGNPRELLNMPGGLTYDTVCTVLQIELMMRAHEAGEHHLAVTIIKPWLKPHPSGVVAMSRP
jgi:hypothetical protein